MPPKIPKKSKRQPKQKKPVKAATVRKKAPPIQFTSSFTWEIARRVRFWLPPETHTIKLTQKGIHFDSQLVPWGEYWGVNCSSDEILIKSRRIDHEAKVIGLSRYTRISLPPALDSLEVIESITAASEKWFQPRNLKGYTLIK